MIKLLKILLCALMVNFMVASAFAEWLLVEDFEDATEESLYFNKRFPPQGVVLFDQDAFDFSNRSFVAVPGLQVENQNNNVTLAIPLPEELPNGAVGTLKYRVLIFGPTINTNLGLSPTVIEVDDSLGTDSGKLVYPESGSFGNFESQMGFTSPFFRPRDGNTFNISDVEVPIQEWFTVYHVIDNGADTTMFYYKMEGMDEPELLVMPDGRQELLFRNGTSEPLRTFYAVWSGGGAGVTVDNVVIDDIYWDPTGVNLDGGTAVEPAPRWAGYLIDDAGWVHTDDFMGSLYVENDPWIYSARLGKYIYLPEEHVDADGAWTFVFE